jgi:hypothetical protein
VKDLAVGERTPAVMRKKTKSRLWEGREFNSLTLSFSLFFTKAKV